MFLEQFDEFKELDPTTAMYSPTPYQITKYKNVLIYNRNQTKSR